MKQILSLALALLPCLAWAQYPSNGNQKITLGEQTTADGLIFRGVAATDTVRKPSIDTMAYMVLDTTTNIIWHYKKATSNAWLRLNLLPSDTASMLTPYWRAGRFSGTLAVANGGTGSATQNFVDLTNTQSSIGGAKTFTSALTATRFNPTSSTTSGTGMYLPKTSTIGFTSNGTNQMAIAPKGISIFKSDTVQNLYVTPMIEIGAQGMIYSASGSTGRFNDYTFGMGFYFDASGVTKYMATTDVNITHQPVRITFYQGSISFDNAVAGTKDNTLTFVNRMKLDENGKLGIGETSPSQALHVVGNGLFTGNLGVGGVTPTSRLHVKGVTNTSGESALNVTNSSDASLLFVRNDGNVGIGTASPANKLHINGTGGGSFVSLGMTNALLRVNATTNTIGEGAAIALSALATKETAWIIAAEHTSGNNGDLTFYAYPGGATYSERMRITSGGNVGIGTASPAVKLHVNGISGVPTTNGNTPNSVLRVQSDVGVGLEFGGLSLTPYSMWMQSIDASGATTRPLSLQPSGGNVGIGTTSPGEKLTIKGGDGNQLLLDNAGENFTQINFAQNGSAKSLLAVDHRTNFKGFLFANQISASDYRKIMFRPDGSNDAVIMNNDEMWVGYTTDQGAYKLQVNSQIFATNATIATSDIRFKENIQPLDKGLEIINKLKPVKFNFISTTENNFSEFDEIGFIAQDVEGALSTELFAKAVVKKLDEDKDDSALGLMTEKLIPILVKAIQEQQALIKAFEQRIINLENK